MEFLKALSKAIFCVIGLFSIATGFTFILLTHPIIGFIILLASLIATFTFMFYQQ